MADWYKLSKPLVQAKGFISFTTGEEVKLDSDAKLVYTVILERNRFFVDNRGAHYDTQESIASLCGVSLKKTGQILRSFIQHGVILGSKGFRGNYTYKKIRSMEYV